MDGLAVEWGPVGVWVGGIATFFAALIALLGSLGYFERYRAPRLRITFDQTEPWCRAAMHPADGEVLWLRVGVENLGKRPARGCIGRLLAITTDGQSRPDVDPIQLRWAGVPPSRYFDPLDIRPGQREFLNVLYLRGSRWRIVTFEDSGFIPGFTTELTATHHHLLTLAIFADNSRTTTTSLAVTLPATQTTLTAHLVDDSAP